jgi:hypothetical protein
MQEVSTFRWSTLDGSVEWVHDPMGARSSMIIHGPSKDQFDEIFSWLTDTFGENDTGDWRYSIVKTSYKTEYFDKDEQLLESQGAGTSYEARFHIPVKNFPLVILRFK